MPGDELTVAQLCGECKAQVGTFTVKKDNLFLASKEKIWCPHCGKETPEVRDLAGRLETIRQEVDSYPQLTPAEPPKPVPAPSGPSGQAGPSGQ